MKALSKQFDLLRAGRIDRFTFSDLRVIFFAGEARNDLEVIPIAGEEELFLNHVACTRGPWGGR